MLINPVKPFRKRRRIKPNAPAKAPPAALNLVAASLDNPGDPSEVVLTFDRAVDSSGMDPAQVTVGTITTGGLYQGFKADQADPNIVHVSLTGIGEYDQSNIMMFATDATGIVAVDDGGTWSGTGGTGLPFP